MMDCGESCKSFRNSTTIPRNLGKTKTSHEHLLELVGNSRFFWRKMLDNPKIVQNHWNIPWNHENPLENLQKILEGSMFSPLLRPCPRWMSQVKPLQVLSHLLLVVTVFALLHPMCQINFLGQTPTSPISSVFCGVPYVLNIVGTHEIRFRGTHEISFPGPKL